MNPWDYDRKRIGEGIGLVGVDEAGRGALAGPVVAAAVFLPGCFFRIRGRRKEVERITDSKQMRADLRESVEGELREWMEAGSLQFAVGSANVDEIEAFNILGATRMAMIRALESLQDGAGGSWCLDPAEANGLIDPALPGNRECGRFPALLLDGRPMRPFPYRHEGLVGGDGISLAIAMGSVVAKVTRDRIMMAMDEEVPGYGFGEHKGYGTASHRKALSGRGPSPQHRPSFIRKVLDMGERSFQERFDFDSAG